MSHDGRLSCHCKRKNFQFRDENIRQPPFCVFFFSRTDWFKTCSDGLSTVDGCCTAVCLSALRPSNPHCLLPTGRRKKNNTVFDFLGKTVKPISATYIKDFFFRFYFLLFSEKKGKKKNIKQRFLFPRGVPGLHTQLPGKGGELRNAADPSSPTPSFNSVPERLTAYVGINLPWHVYFTAFFSGQRK